MNKLKLVWHWFNKLCLDNNLTQTQGGKAHLYKRAKKNCGTKKMREEKEGESTKADYQNKAGNNQGVAGCQLEGQRRRLRRLRVRKVRLLTGTWAWRGSWWSRWEPDHQLDKRSWGLNVWLMELVSDGSLTSDEDPDRFQRGVGGGKIANRTGVSSATHIADVSRPVYCRCGSRVDLTADEGLCQLSCHL